MGDAPATGEAAAAGEPDAAGDAAGDGAGGAACPAPDGAVGLVASAGLAVGLGAGAEVQAARRPPPARTPICTSHCRRDRRRDERRRESADRAPDVAIGASSDVRTRRYRVTGSCRPSTAAGRPTRRAAILYRRMPHCNNRPPEGQAHQTTKAHRRPLCDGPSGNAYFDPPALTGAVNCTSDVVNNQPNPRPVGRHQYDDRDVTSHEILLVPQV